MYFPTNEVFKTRTNKQNTCYFLKNVVINYLSHVSFKNNVFGGH